MDMIDDLAANRKHGRRLGHISAVYLYHPCGSHNIFFREEHTWIVIVRILHNRMEPLRHLQGRRR
jgi:toxin ParE1/3/4